MTFLTAQTAFYYMAAASVASAMLAVTRKNPVHSMLWVLALFLHVAGIFLLLGAPARLQHPTISTRTFPSRDVSRRHIVRCHPSAILWRGFGSG